MLSRLFLLFSIPASLLAQCDAGAPCTTVPAKTWTKLTARGWPAGSLGYEKSAYASALDATCFLGGYHEGQGEPNQALNCFSFTEQRWSVLHDWGTFQDAYGWSAGHPQGLFAWIDSLGAFWTLGGNSGSNMTKRTNHTYLFDVFGQVTRDKYTGVSANPAPYNGGNVVGAATWDPFNSKVVLYGSSLTVAKTWDPSTNLYGAPTASGTVHPGVGYPKLAYRTIDHKVWMYGGYVSGLGNCASTMSTAMTTFDTATNTWATVTQTADPVYGSPSGRLWNGWAYSTADDLFLLTGGCDASNESLQDTWAFHADTSTWERLNTTADWFVLSSTVNRPYDLLVYDSTNNSFVVFMKSLNSDNYSGGVPSTYKTGTWAYCYSACSIAGRTLKTYVPTPGYINTAFTGASTRSDGQVEEGSAKHTALATDGTNFYAAWIESGKSFDATSDRYLRHPYVYSSANGIAWTGRTSYNTLAGATTESEQPKIAWVNGALWMVWSSGATTPANPQLRTAYWSGSSWSSPVTISSVGGTGYYRGISAIAAVGTTPAIASIETRSSVFSTDLYVNQWGGSSWSQLGSSLTINSGGRSLFLDVTSDGSALYVCHTEEVVNSGGLYVTTTPQLYCQYQIGRAHV